MFFSSFLWLTRLQRRPARISGGRGREQRNERRRVIGNQQLDMFGGTMPDCRTCDRKAAPGMIVGSTTSSISAKRLVDAIERGAGRIEAGRRQGRLGELGAQFTARGAVHPMQAMLNYAIGVLAGRITRVVIAKGLDAGFGFLHDGAGQIVAE
jgi:hypothetical protein